MPQHEDSKLQGRYLYSILITFAVLVVEVIGGIWTGSLALLSDSGHVLTDVLALVISFSAYKMAQLPSDDNHTFGYHRLEVFAALFNGISLAIISIGIWWEAAQRFLVPNEILGVPMMVIAVIGFLANILVAVVLKTDHHSDLEHDHIAGDSNNDINLHSAYLHVIGDAVSSVGVIIAGLAIWLTGALWIDPLISIFIGVMIAASSYRVLRRAIHILLEGTPDGISVKEIANAISQINGVEDIHDLHVWNICSGHVSLSAHVALTAEERSNQVEILGLIREMLFTKFSIEHVTIQIEAECCGQGNRVLPNPVN
ncbi:MAG: cation diffusion facilitator family transporter [Leptolinea sp.]